MANNKRGLICAPVCLALLQVPSGEAAVEEGDQLELGVVVNMRTGARRATHVAIVSRLGTQLEFGKVLPFPPFRAKILLHELPQALLHAFSLFDSVATRNL